MADDNTHNGRKFSNEVKKHFLEIVSTYSKYQEQIDRKSDISEIADTLGGITEAARELALNEADDWFDKHTVKRNMNELQKLGKQFDKVSVDAKALDQRLHGLYEDMGHILSRYYKVGELTENEVKTRLGMNESKSPCSCGCGTCDKALTENTLLESSMAELGIIAKESKDFKEFTKEVYKEFPNLPKNKNSLKWLEDIYKTNESTNESLVEELLIEAGVSRMFLSYLGAQNKVRSLEKELKTMVEKWKKESNPKKKDDLLSKMKKKTTTLHKTRKNVDDLERNYINNMSNDTSYSESVNEGTIDKSKKLKIYNSLKKGDNVDIKYDSSIRRGDNFYTFVVTKGKTTVGKRKVERITLQMKDKPKSTKYYLYNTNGNIQLAIGDMAAVITDMKPSSNESINEGLPDKVKGNDGIVWTKQWKRGGVTNYVPIYKGHNIDTGGYNFKSKREMDDFIDNYIVSNQIYNKYRNEITINEVKFIAFYNGKQHEIEGKDLWDAKQKAIKQLRIPKSKQGLLAIKSEKSMKNQDFRFENTINEENPRLNKKTKKFLDDYLRGDKKNSPENQFAIMHILKGALIDANFHSEAKQLDKFFPKAKQADSKWEKMIDVIQDKGVQISKWAKWDGYDIIDALAYYTNMTIGGGFGEKLKSLKESISEARKIKQFDDARSKSKNIAGLVVKVQGKNAVLQTVKGLLKTTLDDLELMPESVNEAETITRDKYNKLPKDYKLKKGSQHYIMKMVNGATSLVPVKIVKELMDESKFGYQTSTSSYIDKHKDEYKTAEKLNKGNENKFYDLLSDMEEKLGHPKFMIWLSNALRGYKVDMYKDPKIKNQGEAEEALFKLSK